MSLQREADGRQRSRVRELGLVLLAGVLVLAVLWWFYLGALAERRLHKAVAEGDVFMARLMCLAVINQNQLKDAPLAQAARLGNVEMGRALLGMGADVNEGHLDSPPLSQAARQGHVEFMRMLLANGADAHQARPLLAASQGCQPEAVKLLLGPEIHPPFGAREVELAQRIAESEGCDEVLRLLPSAPTPSSPQTP
jgi:ankyrin repeat protein